MIILTPLHNTLAAIALLVWTSQLLFAEVLELLTERAFWLADPLNALELISELLLTTCLLFDLLLLPDDEASITGAPPVMPPPPSHAPDVGEDLAALGAAESAPGRALKAVAKTLNQVVAHGGANSTATAAAAKLETEHGMLALGVFLIFISQVCHGSHSMAFPDLR